MMTPAAIRTLSHLAALHHHSLPMYLSYTRPWTRPGTEGKLDVLQHMITDHQYAVEKIVHVLEETDTTIGLGEFPMEYTDLHDLSLAYLFGLLIETQNKLITEIEAGITQLENDTIAKEVAQECLGMAKGHVENLEEAASSLKVMS
ncbi:MAG: hypothetical protein COA78_13460 [Blastopirellula sp.]|nr:MAG: hypothetical protein COA78_13460 [Blastopirellula sp.]